MKYIVKISLIGLGLVTLSFARIAEKNEVASLPSIQLVQGDSFKKQPANEDGDQNSLQRKRSHKRRKKSRGRRAGR